MSDSPWSMYGRMPLNASAAETGDKKDPVACVVNEVMRGREQLEKYLDGVLREYFAIQSGKAGYRSIIDSALPPSSRPETIEERLNRLARESESRRPAPRVRRPRTR